MTELKLQKHILVGNLYGEDVHFMQSPNVGGKIDPTLIVIHHTAGSDDKYNSRNYMLNKDARVSAHIVIETDGTISQLVPFNVRAFHAGVSSYKGTKNVNNFSIGIEIVNPGKLDSYGKSYFGKQYDFMKDGLVEFTHKQAPFHGNSVWLPYSDAQINTLINLCKILKNNYPKIKDIVGHYEISPGRKTDPSPLLDLQHLKNITFGRNDDTEVEYEATVNLNLRSSPVISNETLIGRIKKGGVVEIISCQYLEDDEKWLLVETSDERQGWVSAKYIREK